MDRRRRGALAPASEAALTREVECIPQVVAAAAQALSDVQASGTAALSLTKSVTP
jgi:hypothetical protein